MEPEKDLVSGIAQEAGVDPLCARVLANRGVLPEGALGFLSPSLKNLRAPEEEAWRVAARRVARAVRDEERIGVFGDYDADGITSAAVLYLALSHYTDNVVV
jgi:single-stranded-DNA-specific exonuclease